MDLKNIEREIDDIPMRGLKGTTGTQATFLELFEGDHEKVLECNRKVCAYMGFDKWVPVSGQTYTRKIDYQILRYVVGLYVFSLFTGDTYQSVSCSCLILAPCTVYYPVLLSQLIRCVVIFGYWQT